MTRPFKKRTHHIELRDTLDLPIPKSICKTQNSKPLWGLGSLISLQLRFIQPNKDGRVSALLVLLWAAVWPSLRRKLGRHEGWAAWAKQVPKGSVPAFSCLTLRPIFRLYLFTCWRKGGDSERVVYTSQLEADRTYYKPVSSLWENAAADPKPLETTPLSLFFVQFVDDLKALQARLPSCLMSEDPLGGF